MSIFSFFSRKKNKTEDSEPTKEPIQEIKSKSSKPVISDELREARIKLNLEYIARVAEGAKVYFAKTKPIMKVSVAKVGHCDAYHFYSEPDIGDPESCIVDVSWDTQYHEENYDREREAYVVSIDGAEVGELSNATVEKIEDEIPFYRAKFNVASIKDDGDKVRIKLNVFECEGTPGHRSWPLDLMGINYEGRDKLLKDYGSTVAKLEPTEYDGEPAVKVLDPIDRELGWIPKEHAAEITNKIKSGVISQVRVDNIKIVDDKTYAKVFLTIRNI
ncbi:MAG: hypothetical protein ACOX4A_02140 [Saccharofermentanales bacterium]|jgi:chorismate mutase